MSFSFPTATSFEKKQAKMEVELTFMTDKRLLREHVELPNLNSGSGRDILN